MLAELITAAVAYFQALSTPEFTVDVHDFHDLESIIGRNLFKKNTLLLSTPRGTRKMESEQVLHVICLPGSPGEAHSKADTVALMDWVIGATPDNGILIGDDKYFITGELAYGWIEIPSASSQSPGKSAGIISLKVSGQA